jgi:hypothetical protein
MIEAETGIPAGLGLYSYVGKTMFSKPGVSQTVLGLFVLCLGILMWDITGNYWAYKLFFVASCFMILWGIYIAWRDG